MANILSILSLIIVLVPSLSTAENFSSQDQVLKPISEWNFYGIKAISGTGPYCPQLPRALGCGNDCFKQNDTFTEGLGNESYSRKFHNNAHSEELVKAEKLLKAYVKDLEKNTELPEFEARAARALKIYQQILKE